MEVEISLWGNVRILEKCNCQPR